MCESKNWHEQISVTLREIGEKGSHFNETPEAGHDFVNYY